ncbi:MAG: PDZ domain-containing protein [Gemmatimonadota bacterium]
MRHLMLASALCAAAATLAPSAHAQGRVRLMETGRPRLGVMVDVRSDADNDKLGARIREITPDGPADKAGLKSGDIITRFNGTSLGGVKSDDDEASGPGGKLIDLARKLDDGDTVKVEYRRGAETRTATIVAKALDGATLGQRWKVEGPESGSFNFRMPAMGEIPRTMSLRGMSGPGAGWLRHMGSSNLDLIDLNSDLGEYFGSRDGVLVVSSPRDSTVPLKAGDVILSLDGRKPKSADHAQRILDSYDAGESIKAEVMRKQKRITVTWSAPRERNNVMWRMDGGNSDDDMSGQPKVFIRQRPGQPTPPPPPSDRS